MKRAGAGSLSFGVLISILGASGAARGSGAPEAQPAPDIALDPAIECWYHSEFPVLGATVTPPEDIVRSRLYFRCSLYQDYYFVDLMDEGGSFRGVAPQAEESCPQVLYYVEALSRDFIASRTEERSADVTSPNECRRRYPAAAWFAGDDPNIFLGSTMSGPQMAPGFKSLGIAGFISSTGAPVALGAAEGGVSTGLLAGIAAGGAAAGIGVLASGGSSTTTAPSIVPAPPPPPATTSVPPPPPPAQAVKACVELDPPNGVVEVNTPVRIDGRCSEGGENLQFRFELGDGRTKEGQAFIVATWPVPGSYTLTLTVTRASSSLGARFRQEEDQTSRQITVSRPEPPPEPPGPQPDPVVANFTARNAIPDTCVGEFDASLSTGDIVRYVWDLDVNNDFGQGVIQKEGRVVQHDWKADCFRRNGFLVARLTVIGRSGTSDSLEKTVSILVFVSFTSKRGLETSFATEILEGEGSVGRVMVEGGSPPPVSLGAPTAVSYTGRYGRNTLEAALDGTSEAGSPVLWRFDFSGARGFVPGSLRTVSGQEVARDAFSVLIRFTGAPGERARIEYRLER